MKNELTGRFRKKYFKEKLGSVKMNIVNEDNNIFFVYYSILVRFSFSSHQNDQKGFFEKKQRKKIPIKWLFFVESRFGIPLRGPFAT